MQLAERRLFKCLQSILIFLCRILPFKFIIIVIQLMFLGINMFLAHLKTHFNPRCARAKNESESGQKHIYAREHQLYCYITIQDIKMV